MFFFSTCVSISFLYTLSRCITVAVCVCVCVPKTQRRSTSITPAHHVLTPFISLRCHSVLCSATNFCGCGWHPPSGGGAKPLAFQYCKRSRSSAHHFFRATGASRTRATTPRKLSPRPPFSGAHLLRGSTTCPRSSKRTTMRSRSFSQKCLLQKRRCLNVPRLRTTMECGSLWVPTSAALRQQRAASAS